MLLLIIMMMIMLVHDARLTHCTSASIPLLLLLWTIYTAFD